MAPSQDGHSRRKSLHLFSKASSSSLRTDDGNENHAEKKENKLKKRPRRGSIFNNLPAASESFKDGSISGDVVEGGETKYPVARPRVLQKSRPTSIFGSLGRKSSVQSLDEDEVAIPSIVTTAPSSPPAEYDLESGSVRPSNTILHHGEVQTNHGLFRKKKEYMVLTESHLVRFKTRSRASERFPSIARSPQKGGTMRHPSSASVSSLQEVQSISSHTSLEGDHAIPLYQVVTVYKVDDGRPIFTTEVVWVDEELNGPGSMQMMVHDPKDADLWHSTIRFYRAAAQRARITSTREPFPAKVVQYLVSILENMQDYDIERFRIFRVVRRSCSKSSSRSSLDDVSKLPSTVYYLIFGMTRLHLVSIPEFTDPSVKHMVSKASRNSFGFVTVVAMNVDHSDDVFDLCFRNPLQSPVFLELSSSSATEIVALIHQSILFLKPNWLDYTFKFGGEKFLLDSTGAPSPFEEDNHCFDRTLVAYCMAYNCNPTNIVYTVDCEVEDAPEFRLLQPTTRSYNLTELLAVMRALRYNESFGSISFSGVNLQAMHGTVDQQGGDHVAVSTRSGLDIRTRNSINPVGKSLLLQEVQALALKSYRLRSMNFSDTLPRRRPKDNFEDETEMDPGCEITSALLPLLRGKGLTRVDCLILNGIELGETDFEELTLAFESKNTKIRRLEVARCALGNRGLQLVLSKLEHQNTTVEVLNIADNPGRLGPGRFLATMSHFSRIRRLDISRVTVSSGSGPLIAPEVMLSWNLEELILTGVPINDQTLAALSAYLASPMSQKLYRLQMDQCNLTGAHVALLMRAMSTEGQSPRTLQFHISANRLEKGNDEIVKAIQQSLGPSHLAMRLVDYLTESRFRELLKALRHNTSIISLDISKASLPYDAGDDTCEALRLLFAENTTLQELDISGEQAHLEIARFGIGLSQALTGLKNNRALKILRIEHQNLGLEGANALSSVLEHNSTLTSIYCDRNDISLQGFTTLVNAMERNFTVLDLPIMLEDQAEAIRRMSASVPAPPSAASSTGATVKGSVRKRLTSIGTQKHKEKETAGPTLQDMQQAIQILTQRWQKQAERLTGYLIRNQNIAMGIDTKENHMGLTKSGVGGEDGEEARPTTASNTVEAILDHVRHNTTPKVELGDPLVDEMDVSKLDISDEIAMAFDSQSTLDLEFGVGPSNGDAKERERERERERENASSRTPRASRLFDQQAPDDEGDH